MATPILTPEQMLNVLDTHGGEAKSDLNDGEETPGWFGWSVSDDGVLTITYQPQDEDGDPVTEQATSWRLVPADTAQPTVDDLRATLGEGVHTAFRKGGDGPTSSKIWNLIRDMPQDEWGAVLDFLTYGIDATFPGLFAPADYGDPTDK